MRCWCFGAADRDETVRKNEMFILVKSRGAATLHPLIGDIIDPESVIISDGWSGYN